jgi:multimeric flavodoxin WrbA
MKVIGLVGSPHGEKGATGHLLQIVLKGAESAGAQTELIALKGGSVLPCKGCDACHKKGNCVQNDDFESIKQKIREADGIVLASPNYIFQVSAQLKALLDRCCGIIHCLGFEGKYGASVLTSGGGDEPPIAEYMNHFLITTGVVPVGAVWATMGNITGDGFPDDIRNAANELGVKLVAAAEKKEIPTDVEVKMKAFSERMKTLVQYRQSEWPYEYAYWQERRGMQ